MGKAQIVHVKVGEMPEIKTVDTYWKNLQTLVGGHMDVLYINPHIAMYHHGEGKIIGLPENFQLLTRENDSLRVRDIIVGDVFFATHDDEGEMISLTEDMIDNIMIRWIGRDSFIGRGMR